MNVREKLDYSAKLNSHCPICGGNEGLEITLQQNEVSTAFYNKASTTVEEKLYCHSCKNIIYPVSLNEDLEKVMEYHRKLAGPKNNYLKLKPLSYVLILVAISAVAVTVYSLI